MGMSSTSVLAMDLAKCAKKLCVILQTKQQEAPEVAAQVFIYGLFISRLGTPDNIITIDNIPTRICTNIELIDSIWHLLHDDCCADLVLVVTELLLVINNFDVAAIRAELASLSGAAVEQDLGLYFYEAFLAAYDPNSRKQLGVYYTPLPVVKFIVRGVNDILKDEFGLASGLADKSVTALDFATGTGTFIVEMFKTVLRSLPKQSGKQKHIIKNHLLENFYGFEYMMAPYALAHLKVAEFFKSYGYKLSAQDRVNIYHTNTLETASLDLVKPRDMLVIVGNPPYNINSQNNNNFISQLIKDYKYVNEKLIKGSHALNDDYVKFIRYAQHRVDSVGSGVVGLVVNHSFLDAPTFKGMRYSLMQSFNKIKIINLHGNARRKEKSPDGIKDENVFGIMQGVAIIFLIKSSGGASIDYVSLHGLKASKLKFCSEKSLSEVTFNAIAPHGEFYSFISNKRCVGYESFISIQEIFKIHATAIRTHRDYVVINESKSKLITNIKKLISNDSIANIRSYFDGLKDSWEWKLAEVNKKYLSKKMPDAIIKCAYRPFDNRYIMYHPDFVDGGRFNLMQHMLSGDNIGLVSVRQITSCRWCHAFISKLIVESACVSNKTSETNYLYPVYIYQNNQKTENISPETRAMINAKYNYHPSPETILGYIYGVLYSNHYRTKYLDHLKMDFPRIPFTESREKFESLSKLGWELTQVHLMNEIPFSTIGELKGDGDYEVAKLKYDEIEEKLYINASQYFEKVSIDIWEFCIGGYQVLDKYLKYRKGRKLDYKTEILHLTNVIRVLDFTIKQMKKIDKLYIEIDKEFD